MNRRVVLLLAAAVCAACAACSPSADDLRNDPHGHLIWAARKGDAAAIGDLAAQGVDLDASPATHSIFVFPDFDHVHWTALQHAVQKHHVEAVRTLIDWGADPNATEPGSINRPLFIALFDKDPAIARMLYDAGADVNLARKALNEEGPGGPLWHLVEHAMERVSQQEALAHLDALTRARE